MDKGKKPKYALVKWLTGEDVGKYSIVDSSWLLHFNVAEFEKNKSESYIVEWRDQKKTPLGGWACFDAEVIKLSDMKAGLEKHLSKILLEKQCLVSPKSNKFSLPASANIRNSDDSDADQDHQSTSDAEVPVNGLKMKNKKKVLDLTTAEEAGEKDRLRKKVKLLEEENVGLKLENETLRRQLVEEIPSMLAAIKDIIKQPTKGAPSTSTNTAERINDKIEVLAGSGVFVDAAAWLSAKACSTAGSFVGRLLVSLFSQETLLRSNLKGGAPKFPDRGLERKEQLDPKIIAAIKGAAKLQYPDLKEAQFGTFVNQKIANLRSKEKKDLREEAAKQTPIE